MSDILNFKSRKWVIRITIENVVNAKSDIYNKVLPDGTKMYIYDIKDIIDKLNIISYAYFYALHDSESKPHYHFIIYEPNSISFNRLKELFPYGDISRQRGRNFDCWNYLIHANNPEKHQYPVEIRHTNLNESQLNEWLNSDLDKWNRMLKLVMEYDEPSDLLIDYPEYLSCLSTLLKAYEVMRGISFGGKYK